MTEEIEEKASTRSLEPEKLSNPCSNLLQSDAKQIPQFYDFSAPSSQLPMSLILYPALVPGVFPLQQGQEQMDQGPGIYAVPSLPFMGPIAGFPSNTLIPFTYNVPTGSSPDGTRTGGEEQVQVGQQQQAGQQRQVMVRRFHIAIHLDLLLILKLAAVIFLFNQDGSRKRLVILIFFAVLVYLYQTGALAPIIRWLSQGMQRAQQPRPGGAARQENENAPLAGEGGGENEENEQEQNGNNRWWGGGKRDPIDCFWLHHFSSPWISQH